MEYTFSSQREYKIINSEPNISDNGSGTQIQVAPHSKFQCASSHMSRHSVIATEQKKIISVHFLNTLVRISGREVRKSKTFLQ